jgi:hypothetical protein
MNKQRVSEQDLKERLIMAQDFFQRRETRSRGKAEILCVNSFAYVIFFVTQEH